MKNLLFSFLLLLTADHSWDVFTLIILDSTKSGGQKNASRCTRQALASINYVSQEASIIFHADLLYINSLYPVKNFLSWYNKSPYTRVRGRREFVPNRLVEHSRPDVPPIWRYAALPTPDSSSRIYILSTDTEQDSTYTLAC